jgi:IS30 family transposase
MSHLSFDERVVISTMRLSGSSRREIADHLGRSASTIGRELLRNSSRHDCYRSIEANRLALARRRRPSVVSKLEQHPDLLAKVKEKLLLRWSPEQISGWLKTTDSVHQVSHQTIYRFLLSLEKTDELRQSMRRGGRRNRRQKPGFIKSQLRDRVSIHDRPKVVEGRKRAGDWELDLVRCHRGSGYLITAVDRMTGYTLVRKVARKCSGMVMSGILKMFEPIEWSKIKTFTFDNGTEFFYHSILTEELGVKVYFADPYNSGQRGTNENTNGLLRQYFPKTMNYLNISWQAVAKAQFDLNHRPRLRLGFQTPASRFK